MSYKVPVTTYFTWQEPVLDKDLNSPPGGESKGDRYIVGGSASGDWSGQGGNIAIYNGSGWDFVTKKEGMFCYIKDEDKLYIYITSWTAYISGTNTGDITISDTASVDLGLTGQTLSATVLPAGVDHNSLNNYSANKHIDHTTVSISASTGMSGGGTIASNRSLACTITQYTTALARAACVAQTITNGVTGTAPSQDAVYDALAGKQDTLTTGNLTASSPIALDNTRQVIGGAAVISHATTAGNKHIPAAGVSKQVLRNSGATGTAEWGTITDTAGAVASVTTLNMNNQLTNTLADGTAPFVITSTTKVSNLNVDLHDGVHIDALTSTRLIRYNSTGTKLENATVTETSGALGGITTLSMNNQLTNSLADGTAPFVITSTTKVSNLNVDLHDGVHIAALTSTRLIRYNSTGTQLENATVTETSGALGGITTLSMNNQLTNSLADGTAPFVITSTTKVSNLNVDLHDGVHIDALTSTRLIRYNSTGTKLENATVTETSGALGGITTISMNNQLTNTLAIGNSPFVITSTTVNTNLNADLLDGYHASATAGNNTIVQRNASGYVLANYFNCTADVTLTSPSHLAVQTGSDSYIRWQTPAQFITNLSIITTANLKIPFYTSAGDLDTIGLTTDKAIPFYTTASVLDTIPLVTA